MEIIERAPAKINLGLDVLHKRVDGYHEVESIFASVDLAFFTRGSTESCLSSS